MKMTMFFTLVPDLLRRATHLMHMLDLFRVQSGTSGGYSLSAGQDSSGWPLGGIVESPAELHNFIGRGHCQDFDPASKRRLYPMTEDHQSE